MTKSGARLLVATPVSSAIWEPHTLKVRSERTARASAPFKRVADQGPCGVAFTTTGIRRCRPALSAGNPSESSLPADVQPLPVDHVACTPALDWVTPLWFIRHLTRSLPEPAAVEPMMAFGVIIAVTRSSEARIIGNSHVPKDLPKESRRKISRGQGAGGFDRDKKAVLCSRPNTIANTIEPKRQSTKNVPTGRSLSRKSESSKIWSEASPSSQKTRSGCPPIMIRRCTGLRGRPNLRARCCLRGADSRPRLFMPRAQSHMPTSMKWEAVAFGQRELCLWSKLLLRPVGQKQ
jgi:hypothetical protein